MTRLLIVRPRAEGDIQAAYDWYESEQPGGGEEGLVSLRDRLNDIRTFPEASPTVYRGVSGAIMQRFPYLIFYVVNPDQVSVLAVLHQARDPDDRPRP